MRPENVKTLKKQNQDLQNKFEEGMLVHLRVHEGRYALVDVWMKCGWALFGIQ